jgi:hypothetical protein
MNPIKTEPTPDPSDNDTPRVVFPSGYVLTATQEKNLVDHCLEELTDLSGFVSLAVLENLIMKFA